MINVIFIYKERKVFIQCNLEDKMRYICEKFAVKADIEVDSKIYLYNNKPLSINPELNKTLGQQIDTNDTGDKVITVLDDPDKEYTVKLHYDGAIKEVKVKKDEKYGSLFEQIGSYFSLKAKSFYTLCNGVFIGGEEDLDKSIIQLSNAANKESNEINLLIEANDSFSDDENNEKNDEKINDNEVEKKTPKVDEVSPRVSLINERKKVAKFLFKIYVKLLVQFSLIGFLLCLGFYKKYDKIFTRDNFSFSLTDTFLTLFISYIAIPLYKYKKNKCHCFVIFNILIYIPFIILLCFLMSKLFRKDAILSFIFLIIMDFISVLLFLLIFKRNTGYGILLLSLVLNAIYIYPLFYVYLKFDLVGMNTIISLASTLILYMLFFNNISKKKLDENEGMAAVFFFDYSFFFLFSVTFIILFAALIIIPLCLIVFVVAFALCVGIMTAFSVFGGGIILFFIFIKVFFSLFCKSKKNKANKISKEFE